MFSGKDVPAVGVSIGIERVFAIMEAQLREHAAAVGATIRATETQILVASIGNGMQVRLLPVRVWLGGVDWRWGPVLLQLCSRCGPPAQTFAANIFPNNTPHTPLRLSPTPLPTHTHVTAQAHGARV